MIAFDTNVLVRLLVDDDPAQSRCVRQILRDVGTAAEAIFISNVVLVETVRVMQRRYDLDRGAVLRMLDLLLSVRTFAFEDRAVVVQALDMFRHGRCGFSDCLIVCVSRQAGCPRLHTFDRKMKGMAGVELLSPA